MSMNIIAIENLSFSYSGIEILRDVSFTVPRGDYLGLVGPNGSGKSTLIKNILGILQPGQGRVYLFGELLASFREWPKIGYLPQRLSALNVYFPSTVEEIVRLGVGSDKNSQNVKWILGQMGIEHLASRLIGELSYGEQQRTMLARALAGRPELLILDEPTTALDPETRENFYSLTREINRSQQTTIVLITHDIGTIGMYARHLLYLDKKVIFSGTFEDFCASSDMAGLFGSVSQHIICHQHDGGTA
jgi:zinc transport system ATP-binding protein